MTKPTMADVAREAGVDVSTVSRALNDRTSHLLRQETVERVLAAAGRLGYQPNVLARGLRTQRSHTVGMVIPDLTNPFFPPVVRGVEDVLGDAQYTVILANTDNDPVKEERGLQTMVSRQVEGLLLATSHLDDAAPDAQGLAGLPIVYVNRRGPDERVPSVVPDDLRGIALVVEHLTALGHRRIAHIAGPQDTSTGRTRADAFRAVTSRSAAFDEELVEVADLFGVDAGHRAAHELLDRHGDITALVAANDLLAVGALRALRERRLRVPEDLSLVGFNDMPLVDLLEPPLTTVRIPQYEMGRHAGRILLELILAPDGGAQPVSIAIAPELIVRRSTAPPRQAGQPV